MGNAFNFDILKKVQLIVNYHTLFLENVWFLGYKDRAILSGPSLSKEVLA